MNATSSPNDIDVEAVAAAVVAIVFVAVVFVALQLQSSETLGESDVDKEDDLPSTPTKMHAVVQMVHTDSMMCAIPLISTHLIYGDHYIGRF